MKKLLFLLIIGLSLSQFSNAQTKETNELDARLSQRFDEMMAASYQLKDNGLKSTFKSELKQAILSFPHENFDSLSTRISIVESENKKLAIYSWYDGAGGSWHSMVVLVKFTTKKNKVKVTEIGGNEIETSAFTDAIVYELHELPIEDEFHFLTIGRGTHGSGHHHKIVQIFKIENENLVNCKDCFAFNDNLVVQAARIYDINLAYNAEKMEIAHEEFVEKEGFYMRTGNTITWKLVDGKFEKR